MSDLFLEGFVVRQPAWHGKGNVLADWPGDIESGMTLAGHDHNIIELPVFVGEWLDQEAGLALTPNGVPHLGSHKALARADTKQVVSVMPASYTVIQNRVPWDLVVTIKGVGVKWETAGILGGAFDEDNDLKKGNVYWVLGYNPNPVQVPGDSSPIYRFTLATWSHDGSQALRVRDTHVRVVCANTQHAALYGKGHDYIDLSFRHTKNVHARIEAAKKWRSFSEQKNSAFLEVSAELVALAASEEQVSAFVERLIPMPVGDVVITDRVAHNIEEARGAVFGILNGPTTPSNLRNTAYGLFQAGIEYLDHVRRYRNSDTYFKRNLLTVDAAKAQLLPLVKEVVSA